MRYLPLLEVLLLEPELETQDRGVESQVPASLEISFVRLLLLSSYLASLIELIAVLYWLLKCFVFI